MDLLNHNYQHVLSITGVMLLLLFLILPYIQADMTHSMYADQIDGEKYCAQVNTNSLVRYWVLTSFQRFSGKATIYCLYENSSEDRSVKLNYLDSSSQWVLEQSTPIEGRSSWPIYI